MPCFGLRLLGIGLFISASYLLITQNAWETGNGPIHWTRSIASLILSDFQVAHKPPQSENGKADLNIGWHQDRHYWQVWEEGSELFTAWVALSNVTADAGPMRFVQGSHQWGLLDDGGFYRQDLDDLRAAIPVPDGQIWREQPALLPPGGASFHHCLTFHGSGPNRSAGPRRSLAIHMRTEKSRPVNDRRAGLTAFIDDPERNPVIYQA